MPSRFGILPRYGSNADIKWFEASPCYIYHVGNAWEDGDEFVMEACRVIQAEPGAKRGEGELARMRAFLRLEAQLCSWRFNLVTGAATQEHLHHEKPNTPHLNLHT